MHDLAGHGARGDDGRAGQVDFGLTRAHPAAEVAVRGGDGHLPGSGHAEMVPHAGAAARTLEDSPGLHQGEHVACAQRSQILLRRGGDDDEAHRDAASAHDLGGPRDILRPSVRAGAEERLIDLRAGDLRERHDVVDRMRLRDHRLDGGRIDLVHEGVPRPLVGEDRVVAPLGAAIEVAEDGVIGRDIAVLAAHLGHHVGKHRAFVQRQCRDPVAVPLDRHVVAAVGPEGSDDAKRQVLRRDPRVQSAPHVHAKAFGNADPELAGRPDRRHLRSPNAHREAAHEPRVRRMAVGPDHELAGE